MLQNNTIATWYSSGRHSVESETNGLMNVWPRINVLTSTSNVTLVVENEGYLQKLTNLLIQETENGVLKIKPLLWFDTNARQNI